MQFRRKKAHPFGGNARLALLAGAAALALLLANNFVRDDGDYYDPWLLRGDGDYYDYDPSESEDDAGAGTVAVAAGTRRRRPGRTRTRGAEPSAARDGRRTGDAGAGEGEGAGADAAAPPSSSLLASPEALRGPPLPACDAARHELLPADADGDGGGGGGIDGAFDASRPAVFANWRPPALERWGDRARFRSSFGGYVQYVKGRDVQPLRDGRGEACRASTGGLMDAMRRPSDRKRRPTKKDDVELLFFTNDVENPAFLAALADDYAVPGPLAALPPFAAGGSGDGFRVFSAMERGSSHPFHFHDAAWLGQAAGSRLWYFLPPGKRERPRKAKGCDYLLGRARLPDGATACVQNAGEVVYFPDKWWHATCALEPWSVGVGGQGGSPNGYEQDFQILPGMQKETSVVEEQKKMVECGVLDEEDYGSDVSSSGGGGGGDGGGTGGSGHLAKRQSSAANGEEDWKWYDGNLNEYYNKLERDEHAKRDPNKITSYAVHRWMGPDGSTLTHYELVRQAIYELVLGKFPPPSQSAGDSDRIRVFDAGCGLGPGLMWFEQHEPRWDLVGHTISEEQHKWIVNDLPAHKFRAKLLSYDEPLDGGKESPFSAVYSIEAAIHSPDLKKSLEAWSGALLPGGVVVIIDDFLSLGVPRDDPDVDLFARSWIANAVHTTVEIAAWAGGMGMTLVRDRDLGSEFQIIKRNYRNKAPVLRDEQGRVHQGWLGSKVRQKLMMDGKISYRLIVLQKKGVTAKKDDAMSTKSQSQSCASVPTQTNTNGAKNPTLSITIDPKLMSGKGAKGGQQMACISGWYCCDQGVKLWDELETSRTERTGFLQLPRELFGHYLTSFAKHLTDFYQTYPARYPEGGTEQGIFLDIGGTGSVASGMTQVTSKFANFAGPLKYWVLDSDPDAKKLTNAVVCDIDNCPAAPDCGYDVTFSHTVLEHAARPWKSFDTIARITKRGGLTLHLVPWSYQYHATPDDNYRFSHKALRTLLEDRGFEVLDVGYDVCTQPEHMLKTRKDEHFEKIWLTYVVGRKL